METVSNQFLMNRASIYSEIFNHLLQNMEGKGIRNKAQGPLAVTLGDFIKAHSKSDLVLFTPEGYVNLTPEQGQALPSGHAVCGHLGNPRYTVRMEAEELLSQVVLNAEGRNGVWYLLADSPPLEQSEPDQEVQMC